MAIPRYLTQAIRLLHERRPDPILRFPLAAVVELNGSIIGRGVNFSEALPWSKRMRYEAYALDAHPFCNTHAEMAALNDAVNRSNTVQGAKIYVARMTVGKSLALSRPCVICQAILYRYGIRKAYYTIDKNTYGLMKIKANGVCVDEVRYL